MIDFNLINASYYIILRVCSTKGVVIDYLADSPADAQNSKAFSTSPASAIDVICAGANSESQFNASIKAF